MKSVIRSISFVYRDVCLRLRSFAVAGGLRDLNYVNNNYDNKNTINNLQKMKVMLYKCVKINDE